MLVRSSILTSTWFLFFFYSQRWINSNNNNNNKHAVAARISAQPHVFHFFNFQRKLHRPNQSCHGTKSVRGLFPGIISCISVQIFEELLALLVILKNVANVAICSSQLTITTQKYYISNSNTRSLMSNYWLFSENNISLFQEMSLTFFKNL